MAFKPSYKKTAIDTVKSNIDNYIHIYKMKGAEGYDGLDKITKISDNEIQLNFYSYGSAGTFLYYFPDVIKTSLPLGYSTINLTKSQAESLFQKLGLVKFGKTHKRTMWDALLWELSSQIVHTITLSKVNKFPEITMDKKCFTMAMNTNGTSGGPEKIFNEIEAAGIIPFDIVNNECYFLLGYDPNQKQWKYFGGGKEHYDTNPRQTAFREFKEETCQVGGMCYLEEFVLPIQDLITNGKALCIPKLNSQSQEWNNFYFTRIDKKKFLDNRNITGIQNNEVTQMIWFSGSSISAIKDSFQTTIKHKEGKIHPPIIAIFRDHTICDELKKLAGPQPTTITKLCKQCQKHNQLGTSEFCSKACQDFFIKQQKEINDLLSNLNLIYQRQEAIQKIQNNL